VPDVSTRATRIRPGQTLVAATRVAKRQFRSGVRYRIGSAEALAADGWADEARRELAVVRSVARAVGATTWLAQADAIAGSDEQAS
jgi:hypothetical protein